MRVSSKQIDGELMTPCHLDLGEDRIRFEIDSNRYPEVFVAQHCRATEIDERASLLE
jgi:hypothetical protein